MRKISLPIILFALLILSACAAGRDNSDIDFATEAPMAWDATPIETPAFRGRASHNYTIFAEEADFLADTASTSATNRMLIKRANINMQAPADEFDAVMYALRQVSGDFDGFIESSNMSAREAWISRNETQIHRHFNITIRVPSEHFDTAKRHVESLGRVILSDESADDVTDRFYDMAGRLETRRVEEQRVLQLIDGAVYINDLLALEDRLSQIRVQIEIYRSQMESMAGQAAFSTIHVTLSEETSVVAATTASLGGRISGAFIGSADGTANILGEIIIFLAAAVLPLAIISLLTFSGIFIVKRLIRRRGAI
ncbi:MAG: DUF4349 domain-containing protein [Defluviitaleaceae bacterium]|nr:DUF4349 domain-containing protein [Defluviitaleaceae bacterium]